MTAVLRRRPDIDRHLVERMGLNRPIVDLIYISFLGSVAAHVAGGGFSNKPIENLATMMLVLGLYGSRLILLAPRVRLLLKKPPPFQFFFVMQALLMPLRLALGLWNGEPRVYVATDFLLALTAIIVYVVSRAEYERLLPISDQQTFRGLYLATMIMLFLGALPVTLASPGVVVTMMGASMVFLFFATHRPLWQSLAGLAVLGACLVHVPRGMLLGIGTVAFLIALANIFWRSILLTIVGVVALATFIILNFQTLPNLPKRVVAIGEIVQAAEQVNWKKVSVEDVLALANVSPSIHERVWEAQQVVLALNKQGAFAWIFGMGYGTSLDFTDAPDPTVSNAAKAAGLLGGGLVHNVHLIIFEQLLRFGLLGLSIFLWVGWRMLQVYWRCRRVVLRNRKVTFDLVCIFTVIGSYIYFQFASDWDIAFVAFGILGYFDARFERIRQSQYQEKDAAKCEGHAVASPA